MTELKQLEGLEVPIVTQAIGAYREVVVSPEFAELERLRADARHNEASALANAEHKTKIGVAKNLLLVDVSIDKILTATGLTRAEVEVLRGIS